MQVHRIPQRGFLDGVVGVTLGRLSGFEDYVDQDWTVIDVLRDGLDDLGLLTPSAAMEVASAATNALRRDRSAARSGRRAPRNGAASAVLFTGAA